MSYYKIIDGKKMESKLIDLATLCIQGAGDGRISIKEAELLFELVKDGNTITDVERDTMDYIFEHYRWTPGALEWFDKTARAWELQRVPETMTVEELSKHHFTKHDVLTDEKAKLTRKNELKAATHETNDNHDEIELRIRLNDGKTIRVLSNFIELEGDFVALRGGCLVPVRAVEKVEI